MLSRATLFVLLLLAASGGLVAAQVQRSSVPYGDLGPTFDSLSVSYPYPNAYDSIRRVNFRDLALRLKGEHTSAFPLKDGKYKRTTRLQTDDVSLDSVDFLPARESGREYALVLYDWVSASGSSEDTGIGEVYELFDHRLKAVQQIDWDRHYGEPPDDRFDERDGTLVFRSSHYIGSDAHCCISAVDVVTMHWDGSKFTQVAISTELSEYGKSNGAKLPAN